MNEIVSVNDLEIVRERFHIHLHLFQTYLYHLCPHRHRVFVSLMLWTVIAKYRTVAALGNANAEPQGAEGHAVLNKRRRRIHVRISGFFM